MADEATMNVGAPDEEEFLMVEAGSAADSESEADARSQGEALSASAAALGQLSLGDEGADEDKTAAREEEEDESEENEDRETLSMAQTADFLSDAGAADDKGAPLDLSRLDADQLGKASRVLQALFASGEAHLDSSADGAALRAALGHRHVVQAAQAFLSSGAVCEAVLEAARSEQPRAAVLRHTGNLLVTLGDLINRAPELAASGPALVALLLRGELPAAQQVEQQQQQQQQQQQLELLSQSPNGVWTDERKLMLARETCVQKPYIDKSIWQNISASLRQNPYFAGVPNEQLDPSEVQYTFRQLMIDFEMVRETEINTALLTPVRKALVEYMEQTRMDMFAWLQSSSAQQQAEQAQEAKKTAVEHKHVLCDGCVTDERRAVSAAAGTRVGDYIAGVRWKSAIIEDFDLCTACEATGAWEESHGPFLKITAPKKAPRQLIVVLRGDEPPQQQQQDASRCSWRNRGHGRCRSSRRPQAPVAREEEEADDEMVCPLGGHKLEGFCASIGFTCDVCRCAPGFGQPMFGCRRCNWDICVGCSSAQRQPKPQQDAQPKPQQDAQPKQQESQPQQPQQPASGEARPTARFVADVSLPDGSVVLPGAALTKTWRMENPAQQAWPAGVRIVCVGGERMGGPEAGVSLAQLPPQEHLDVNLQLQAPQRPGRYVGYWRLVTADNLRFGHRLWIDLTVAAPDRFGPQLRELADMGFDADAQLLRILEEEDGDLSRVVPRLCN